MTGGENERNEMSCIVYVLVKTNVFYRHRQRKEEQKEQRISLKSHT